MHNNFAKYRGIFHWSGQGYYGLVMVYFGTRIYLFIDVLVCTFFRLFRRSENSKLNINYPSTFQILVS